MVEEIWCVIVLRSLRFPLIDRQLGDMFYMDFMGQPAIVINKRQVAIELLDKRSAIYSNRPVLVSPLHNS